MLADNPKVALAAVVHALALDCFYSTVPTDSVLRIGPTVVSRPQRGGHRGHEPHKQLEATTKAVRKRLPKDRRSCGAG